MDPKSLEAIRQIVNEAVANPFVGAWYFWVAVVALPSISAWLGAYFTKKGETAALKSDLDEIQNQLKTNTEITEEVKAKVGFEEWWARETFSARRSTLERLTTRALETPEEVHAWWINATSPGDAYPPFPMAGLHELSTLANLYHPDLCAKVNAVKIASLDFSEPAAEIWQRHRDNNPRNPEVSRQIFEARRDAGRRLWNALLSARSDLESAAHAEMQNLFVHPPSLARQPTRDRAPRAQEHTVD